MMCLHMFLAFCCRLADPLFIPRLEHLTTAWVSFIEHLGKEVAIPYLLKINSLLAGAELACARPTSNRAEVEPSTLVISMTVRSVFSSMWMVYLPGGSLTFPAWN